MAKCNKTQSYVSFPLFLDSLEILLYVNYLLPLSADGPPQLLVPIAAIPVVTNITRTLKVQESKNQYAQNLLFFQNSLKHDHVVLWGIKRLCNLVTSLLLPNVFPQVLVSAAYSTLTVLQHSSSKAVSLLSGYHKKDINPFSLLNVKQLDTH